MKFHRVHYKTLADGSRGFAWFTRARAAEQAASGFRIDHADEDPDATTVEAIDVPTNRAGLLAFLNEYAAHEQNG